MCIIQYVISRHILDDTISLHGNNVDVQSREFAHFFFFSSLVLTVGSPLVLSSTLIHLFIIFSVETMLRMRRILSTTSACSNGFKSNASEDELHSEVEGIFNA